MLRVKRLIVAVIAASCVPLVGCYRPDAKIEADAMWEGDRAIYLILTDQLQRIRNVTQKPAKVCLAAMIQGQYGVLTPVSQAVADRLAGEQAGIQPKLELANSVECIAYYVDDSALYASEPTDVLIYAGALDGVPGTLDDLGFSSSCDKWFGGRHGLEAADTRVHYEVEVENGVAKLTGGEDCRSLMWYRS